MIRFSIAAVELLAADAILSFSNDMTSLIHLLILT